MTSQSYTKTQDYYTLGQFSKFLEPEAGNLLVAAPSNMSTLQLQFMLTCFIAHG
jgi:hypothetical protein